MEGDRENSRGWTRREACWAFLLALLLAVTVVGRASWDGELVYCATDTATVQAPWSVPGPPSNPSLSDEGVAFYPHYVRVSERWRAGEVPLWNPDIYLGVPLAANPQWGAYDPQVLALVALEALGGRALFDRGFAWLAIARLALAALGAYLLARELGAGRLAAALCGVGFGTSGSLVLWLGYSLAHVTPWLPWMLLGVEGLRRVASRRAVLLAAAATTLALLGGHPETSFFVVLAGALWSLTLFGDSARHGALALASLAAGALLAAPSWLPFLEYLRHSGALVAHELARGERARPDLLVLGALVVWTWAIARTRASSLSRAGKALAFGLASAALVMLLRARGLDLRFGAGGEDFAERASAWVALPILGLAAAALFAGSGRGAADRLVAFGAPLALLLALEAPGVVGLWELAPLVGLAAPARAACLAALFVPLSVALAHERMDGAARHGAFLVCVFVFFWIPWRGPTSLDPGAVTLDAPDELVVLERVPGPRVGREVSELEGRLDAALEVDALRLVIEHLDAAGAPDGEGYTRAVELDARAEGAWRGFRTGALEVRALTPGTWLFTLEFLSGERIVAARRVAATRVEEPGGSEPRRRTLIVLVLTLAWLLRSGSAGGASAATVTGMLRGLRGGLWIAASVVSGLGFASGWNTATPRARHFHESATERLLTERYPGARVLCERGILPANTGLLAGVPMVDGYDALDVASFDGFRSAALRSGANPLLDWNARGLDLESPAFALLGVELLLLHPGSPAPEGWRLVAGPEDEGAAIEVEAYLAAEPLPRAFCVGEVLRREEVLANLGAFDPARSAFVEPELELGEPMSASTVREVERRDELLRYEVELDGDGLLVTLEQHFPGWQVRVDGERRRLLRVDSLLRGVALGPGRHEVEFRYAPASFTWGLRLALAGLALLVLELALLRPARGARANPST